MTSLAEDDTDTTTTTKLHAGLVETNQKVEASLLQSIQEHVESHSPKDGLDFLHVKNTLLLSYLIDLVVYLKSKLSGEAPAKGCLRRLNEMKVILDKTRSLDKKLRYQIDKLLQAENAASFATAGPSAAVEENNNSAQDDPLQYRPDPSAFGDDNSDDDDSDGSGSDNNDNDSQNNTDGDNEEEMDDDLAAAKQTIAMAKQSDSKKKKKKSKNSDSDDDEDDNNDEPKIYKAPRHTAMPYLQDHEQKEAAKEQRRLRKMRTSELAQSLRHQYSEQPEMEDVFGGTEYGKQAQAAKQLARREEERTKYEEDYLMRLTITRKEKKERKRLMRLEGANLNGIADLGNLVRDASRVIGDNDDNDSSGRKSRRGELSANSERHASGKRKKELLDADGRVQTTSKRSKAAKAKNSYQAALFGGGGSGKKKKSKR